MAKGEKKERSPIPIIAAVVALLIAAAAAIWLTRPQGADPNATPPEMGPDMASAAPADQATLATAATKADPVFSAASATQTTVAFEDESLSFSVALPAGPENDPVLTHLREDSESYLVKVKANARADFNRLKASGVKPYPWEVRAKWTYTARAGDIVSLVGESSEYNGGAHPMLMFDTYIGRSTGEQLKMDDMLIFKRSPSPAMIIAICEALKAAKTSKVKSATIFDEPIVCAGPEANAKTDVAKIALAPSNQPDRFGGLYAYYEPYAVGAYSEGPYRLTVQQEIFAEDLKPEFRKLFAGEAPVL